MNDAATPKCRGTPGNVEIRIDCGDGYNFAVLVDAETGEFSVIQKGEGGDDDLDMVCCTKHGWPALRESIDAALLLHELSLSSHEEPDNGRLKKNLPAIVHHALSAFGVTDFSPEAVAKIDIVGLRRQGNFGPARELVLREWLEGHGQDLVSWPPFKMPNSYQGRQRQW